MSERYEYRIVQFRRKDEAEEALNRLAAEGFRVVASAAPNGDYVWWTLERETPSATPHRG